MVVLESTTYPGTTVEVVVPILEKSCPKVDKDFYVAFSPEREDPNNPHHTTETIPKVVVATSKDGLEVANAVYSQIVVRTVPVSSTQVAEATKLMENIFRTVNIALVNELKVTFMKMGIDIWEVIALDLFSLLGKYPDACVGFNDRAAGLLIPRPLAAGSFIWIYWIFGYTTSFLETGFQLCC